MKQTVLKITRGGQITIPNHVLQTLDLEKGDSIIMALEAGEVKLKVVSNKVGKLSKKMKTRDVKVSKEEIKERIKVLKSIKGDWFDINDYKKMRKETEKSLKRHGL